MIEYSEKEKRLFEHFGLSRNYIENVDSPQHLYRTCVEVAFIEKMDDIYVDVLRKAYKVLFILCNMYRMTEEFENLLKFE